MEEKFGISTKKLMHEELKEKFSSTRDFIITNYKGLSSLEIEKLRKELNKASSRYFVVKNSIAKRVFSQLKLEKMNEFIKGEVGIGFTENVLGASKALVKFAKENNVFKIKCAFLDGQAESADRIQALAALPSKEVLLAMTLSSMKSPITGFVGTLRGLLQSLLSVLTEIRKKGGTK